MENEAMDDKSAQIQAHSQVRDDLFTLLAQSDALHDVLQVRFWQHLQLQLSLCRNALPGNALTPTQFVSAAGNGMHEQCLPVTDHFRLACASAAVAAAQEDRHTWDALYRQQLAAKTTYSPKPSLCPYDAAHIIYWTKADVLREYAFQQLRKRRRNEDPTAAAPVHSVYFYAFLTFQVAAFLGCFIWIGQGLLHKNEYLCMNWVLASGPLVFLSLLYLLDDLQRRLSWPQWRASAATLRMCLCVIVLVTVVTFLVIMR